MDDKTLVRIYEELVTPSKLRLLEGGWLGKDGGKLFAGAELPLFLHWIFCNQNIIWGISRELYRNLRPTAMQVRYLQPIRIGEPLSKEESIEVLGREMVRVERKYFGLRGAKIEESFRYSRDVSLPPLSGSVVHEQRVPVEAWWSLTGNYMFEDGVESLFGCESENRPVSVLFLVARIMTIVGAVLCPNGFRPFTFDFWMEGALEVPRDRRSELQLRIWSTNGIEMSVGGLKGAGFFSFTDDAVGVKGAKLK